jgi:hypothetical protein
VSVLEVAGRMLGLSPHRYADVRTSTFKMRDEERAVVRSPQESIHRWDVLVAVFARKLDVIHWVRHDRDAFICFVSQAAAQSRHTARSLAPSPAITHDTCSLHGFSSSAPSQG